MKNQKEVSEWLNRAFSNLERARFGKVSDSFYYEDLCFDCQQAVEKSLKGLIVYLDEEIPWTHSISQLNKVISSHYQLNSELIQAETLSFYAGRTRYPGDYEPLTESDYKEALSIAEYVCNWVSEQIRFV